MIKKATAISKSIQEMENGYIAQINELLAQNQVLRLMLTRDPIDPLLIKQSGIPNVVFGYAGSIRSGEDAREPEWKEQRMKRGFDDTELWGLDSTVAAFIVPRLERLIEIFPSPQLNSVEQFSDVLEAMKLIAADRTYTADEEETIKKGLGVFPRVFRRWWF